MISFLSSADRLVLLFLLKQNFPLLSRWNRGKPSSTPLLPLFFLYFPVRIIFPADWILSRLPSSYCVKMNLVWYQIGAVRLVPRCCSVRVREGVAIPSKLSFSLFSSSPVSWLVSVTDSCLGVYLQPFHPSCVWPLEQRHFHYLRKLLQLSV